MATRSPQRPFRLPMSTIGYRPSAPPSNPDQIANAVERAEATQTGGPGKPLTLPHNWSGFDKTFAPQAAGAVESRHPNIQSVFNPPSTSAGVATAAPTDVNSAGVQHALNTAAGSGAITPTLSVTRGPNGQPMPVPTGGNTLASTYGTGSSHAAGAGPAVMESTAAATTPTGIQHNAVQTDWQQQVMKAHPDIAIAGSDANKAFVKNYTQAMTKGGGFDPIALSHSTMSDLEKQRGQIAGAPSEGPAEAAAYAKANPVQPKPGVAFVGNQKPGLSDAENTGEVGTVAPLPADANTAGLPRNQGVGKMLVKGTQQPDVNPFTGEDENTKNVADQIAQYHQDPAGYVSAHSNSQVPSTASTPATPAPVSDNSTPTPPAAPAAPSVASTSSPAPTNMAAGGFIPETTNDASWKGDMQSAQNAEQGNLDSATASLQGDLRSEGFTNANISEPNLGTQNLNTQNGAKVSVPGTAGDNDSTQMPRNYAKGKMPFQFPKPMATAMQRERTAIKHHVGGAKPGDKPEIIKLSDNRNAVANTGEKVINSALGTMVLNRDEQRKPWKFPIK